MEEKTEKLLQRRAASIPKAVFNVTPLFVKQAHGAVLVDVDGKEYIDFAGGIAVMNIGHSHPKVVAAIKTQAEKFTHTCFMVNPYEPAVKLAEKLCRITPGDYHQMHRRGWMAPQLAQQVVDGRLVNDVVIIQHQDKRGRKLG